MYKKNKRSLKISSKAILYSFVVLVIVSTLLFALEKAKITSIFTPSEPTYKDDSRTTSSSPSAQADFNGGDSARENKDPGNTLREDAGSAVITDNNGAVSTNSDKSIVSQSGEITTYLPHAGSMLPNGQEVSGKSSLQNVYYRLIDSVSGVIATGQLKVVNGNFSGTLSFNTQASEGRLDIFGTRSDASEFSNIEIPVRFK